MTNDQSKELFVRASKVLPGGVNSPVRAFKSVGGEPLFITRAAGSHIHDSDGNKYVDFVGSWGPLILGHAYPSLVEAVVEAARSGTSFGATTEREVDLAEKVVACVPSLQKVRFVNSGTEATMSALRLARGATNRAKVIKFAGCYHGHADAFLSDSAGSGLATLGIPGSAGVPDGAARDTITLPYNDLEGARQVLQEVGSEVAAIIVEPVACNMGLVVPVPGFLQGLRGLCDKHGALLIFDEVITGFRLGLGGAQERFGVLPDLTTFGKVIGGGLPVGAYGGSSDLMAHIAPDGSVYQAGTLSGNPLAMAAGLATLRAISEPDFFTKLQARTDHFTQGLHTILEDADYPAYLCRIGSIFYLWFKAEAESAPKNYEDIKTADSEKFARFFSGLLQEGVYIAPSAFEVGFVSAVHSIDDLDFTLDKMAKVLSSL